MNNADDLKEVPKELANHPMSKWIINKGWKWFNHQIEALETAQLKKDFILFAPTGAGKTLSGFLPSLIDLQNNGSNGKLHTIYISPLKALAVDVHRNIGKPVDELNLPITYETRTGDTPQSRRQRQKNKPPDILMTTPESLALMLSYEDSDEYFKDLKYVIIDELHAFLHTKRADLLSLNLERLRKFAPKACRIGLSATLADKKTAKDWLFRRGGVVIEVPNLIKPEVTILQSKERMPWSGHSAKYAVHSIYNQIKNAKMSVVFVNTRAQAEYMFQNLWNENDDNLKIGLHHGSLEKELRRKVETQMADGKLDCVVATGSLDLGLDWADVDLVVQVGAPKGVSRLLQRIGRSNHRLDEPSKAILVPTNRFEYIECVAAMNEITKGRLDGIDEKEGGLDVLAQHVMGVACHGPFNTTHLYEEVTQAWPYKHLTRDDFDRVIGLVKDGGYALKTYERFNRLIEVEGKSDIYQIANKRDIRRYRMNIGTIVESPYMKIMIRNKTLGSIEENFIINLSVGDTFLFGGQVLQFEGIHNSIVMVKRSKDKQAQIPSYAGGRMPLSTHLSSVVRHLIGNDKTWDQFPSQISEWLDHQKNNSKLPNKKTLLIETFPRKKKFYTVIYTFSGRNANDTLGFLALRRMKRLGLKPLGFTVTDYALAIWSFKKVGNPKDIFEPGLIYEEFEEWIQDTPLIKRLFRDAAIISGLIERRHPGATKSGRQVLISSDLIYDVLVKYDPQHILLKAAHLDAKKGLIDSGRIEQFLLETKDNVVHVDLDKISPLAVPTVLQLSRQTMAKKDKDEYILEDMEAEILNEAGLQ